MFVPIMYLIRSLENDRLKEVERQYRAAVLVTLTDSVLLASRLAKGSLYVFIYTENVVARFLGSLL